MGSFHVHFCKIFLLFFALRLWHYSTRRRAGLYYWRLELLTPSQATSGGHKKQIFCSDVLSDVAKKSFEARKTQQRPADVM